MKKIILMLATLPILSMSASAQLFKPYNPNLTFKNELHFNFKPRVGYSIHKPSSLELNYKRFLNEKNALRLSPYFFGSTNGSWSSPMLYDGSKIYQVVNVSNRSATLGLKLGYERVKSFGRWKLYYGVDLNVSYNVMSHHSYEVVYKENSMFPGGSRMDFGTNTIENHTYPLYSLGITPFFGIRYEASKRLILSAETGVNLMFNPVKRLTGGRMINVDPIRPYAKFSIGYKF